MKFDFTSKRPAVCIPLTGKTLSEVYEEIAFAEEVPADVLEWRIDHFTEDISGALECIKKHAKDIPLLCTVRTKPEGGNAELSLREYIELLSGLISGGQCELVDIEWYFGEEAVRGLCDLCAESGVKAVVSKHDFKMTPTAGEIADSLISMKKAGAFLPKYAVTPNSAEDVLSLLTATCEASKEIGPVITMAMGEMGKLTRAAGGIFGSCLTFAAGKNSSAPGQIDAKRLCEMLKSFGLR